MRKTRVLFIAHEMEPYLRLSEVADFARMLPQAMQEKGFEIRVLMPRYGCVNERRHRLHEVVRLSGINIVIGDNDNPLIIKVASLPAAKMQVYFLDNEEYFQRKYSIRDDKGKFFDDNHERMIFFNKGALDTVIKLGWSPDIVFCNGWMSSLVPLYIKKLYHDNPIFKDTKVIYSVYNNHFEEKLPADFIEKAVYDEMTTEDLALAKDLRIQDLYKLGMNYADAITVGEQTIDTEVQQFMLELNEKPTLSFVPVAEAADPYFEFFTKVVTRQPELIG